ncbi:MAG TPA: hypothetical protein VFH37_01960 [Candidatus Saccharimonadales bacterium]|nr:hypothetical protein [Candidatus Saccharimonadales bacterium]
MDKRLSNLQLRTWLTVVGAAVLIIGTAYAMVQQSTRLSADDLPLTTAQVTKQELQSGSNPGDVVPSLKTNLRTDTSVFVIITDNSKHVLASSASLDGQTPLPPSGVFSFTAQQGTDHFTWQPENGVRLATRVENYTNGSDKGFIIAGQSLKPYEDRINTYTWLAGAGLLATAAWSYLLLLLPRLKK